VPPLRDGMTQSMKKHFHTRRRQSIYFAPQLRETPHGFFHEPFVPPARGMTQSL
jgi:hypothetical protein